MTPPEKKIAQAGDVFEFTANLNPIAWKAPSLGTIRRGGKIVPTAAPNAEMQVYKNALRELLEPHWDYEPITAPVILRWYFTRRLESYESVSGRTVVKHRMDLTNLTKSAEDALQPWLIHNDVQVVESCAKIVRQERDVERPSVHFTVQVLESQ